MVKFSSLVLLLFIAEKKKSSVLTHKLLHDGDGLGCKMEMMEHSSRSLSVSLLEIKYNKVNDGVHILSSNNRGTHR
jgi:hypothetical protein